MTLVTGRVGACTWSVVQGSLDEATTDRFVEYLRDLADNIVPNQVVLDITRDVGMPTPVQRGRIIDAIKGAPKLELIAGHALVIDSVVGRGLLTAINWVVRPPFEEKLFPDPSAAVAWLQGRNGGIAGNEVMARIASAVPGFDGWNW